MKKLNFFVVIAILLCSAPLAGAQVPSTTSDRIPIMARMTFHYDKAHPDKVIKNEEQVNRFGVGMLLQTHPEFQLQNGVPTVKTGVEMKFTASRVSFKPPPGSNGQIVFTSIRAYGQAACENFGGRIGRLGCFFSQMARNLLISRAPRYTSTWRYNLDLLPSVLNDANCDPVNQRCWVVNTFGLSSLPRDVAYDVIYWEDDRQQGQIVLLSGTNIEVGEMWMDESAKMVVKDFFSHPQNLHTAQLLQPLREAIAQRQGKERK